MGHFLKVSRAPQNAWPHFLILSGGGGGGGTTNGRWRRGGVGPIVRQRTGRCGGERSGGGPCRRIDLGRSHVCQCGVMCGVQLYYM